MDFKRVLGLLLSAVALGLIVWGLWFAKAGLSFDVALQPSSAKNLISTIAYTQNVYVAEDGSLSIGRVPTRLDALDTDLTAAFSKAMAPTAKALQPVVIWASPKTQRLHVDAARQAITAGGWTKVSLSMAATR